MIASGYFRAVNVQLGALSDKEAQNVGFGDRLPLSAASGNCPFLLPFLTALSY